MMNKNFEKLLTELQTFGLGHDQAERILIKQESNLMFKISDPNFNAREIASETLFVWAYDLAEKSGRAFQEELTKC
jgi:hypothetical protein